MGRVRAGLGPVLALAGLLGAGAAHPAPVSAVVIGDFQNELGCGTDFDFGCAQTALADPGDGVWRRTLTLPGGDWSYKVAVDAGAGGVFPAGPNLPVSLAAPTDVRFYYEAATNYVTDNIASVIATLAGNFQSELGCGGDFQPSCLRTWLTDPDGDGILTFVTNDIPVGMWGLVVAHDEAFNEVYGPGGALNSGQNINFTVSAPGTTSFRYDSRTHILTIDTGDTPTPVPLPAGALLLATCLAALGLVRTLRTHRAA